MISKEHLIDMMLNCCPSFGPVLEKMKELDRSLYYCVAGCFVGHLEELYKQQDTDVFSEVAKMIESFLVEGDSFVRDFATVGILEGMQNCRSDNFDTYIFQNHLLPKSKKQWNELNIFWEKVGRAQQNKIDKYYRDLTIESEGYFSYIIGVMKRFLLAKWIS